MWQPCCCCCSNVGRIGDGSVDLHSRRDQPQGPGCQPPNSSMSAAGRLTGPCPGPWSPVPTTAPTACELTTLNEPLLRAHEAESRTATGGHGSAQRRASAASRLSHVRPRESRVAPLPPPLPPVPEDRRGCARSAPAQPAPQPPKLGCARIYSAVPPAPPLGLPPLSTSFSQDLGKLHALRVSPAAAEPVAHVRALRSRRLLQSHSIR